MPSKRVIEKQRHLLGRVMALILLLLLGCAWLLAGNSSWLPSAINQDTPALVSTSTAGASPPSAAQGDVVSQASPTAEKQLPSTGSSTESTAERTLVIHLTGAVQRPGLIELPYDATVADAVDAAGGFTASAARDYVNLAGHLENNSLLRIPSQNEVSSHPPPVFLTDQAVKERGDSSDSKSSDSSGELPRVNINTASENDLETLPGIGPSLATAIIRERETGGAFASIDELMRVPGIKEGKMDQLRRYVTV